MTWPVPTSHSSRVCLHTHTVLSKPIRLLHPFNTHSSPSATSTSSASHLPFPFSHPSSQLHLHHHHHHPTTSSPISFSVSLSSFSSPSCSTQQSFIRHLPVHNRRVIMSTPVKTSAKSHPARKYTIKELLRMRITIPFVCCPLDRFGPDAYTYGIIKVYLVNQHPVVCLLCFFIVKLAVSDGLSARTLSGYGFL